LGKTLLLSPRLSDRAVIAASNSVGGAGATNLQNQRPNLVWQSTTLTPYITLNLTGAVADALLGIDTLFLGYFNAHFESIDSFRLRGANSEVDLTADPGYDSGEGIQYEYGMSEFFADEVYAMPHRLFTFDHGGFAYPWWRIDFDWSGNNDGYVRGGRIMLGKGLVPANTADGGWEARHSEPVVETEDLGGGLSTRIRGARRSASLRWPEGALTPNEGSAIQRMLLERGSAKDVAVCLDTEVALSTSGGDNNVDRMQSLYLGRVKQPVVIKHMPVAYRGFGFEVEELAATEMRVL
jgi:hypothetical protein